MISKRFMGNDIHTAVSTIAAQTAGFGPEEVLQIAEHSHDPDYQDLLFDRGWKHIYIPLSGFGGACSMASKRYMTVVNNKDVMELGRASHYLADLASVFHTTLAGQSYHKFYEEFLDIVQDVVIPYTVEYAYPAGEIQQMCAEFASEVFMHYPVIYQSLVSWDEPVVIAEYKALLEQAALLTTNMFLKYRQDVAAGVQYIVPVEPGLNTSMMLAVAPFILLMPF